jgi:peptidoglycan hydrolase-like protein with peptidoglycan-binding domain
MNLARNPIEDDPGDIDGVLGSATLSAVEDFQRANELARGGITMETLKALNVKLR